jgi:hypothetical protein
LTKQDKEGHSILIKGEIDQNKIIIINLYAGDSKMVAGGRKQKASLL